MDPKKQKSLPRGLRTTIRNNSSAYGYSILVTITFAAINQRRGGFHAWQLFVFIAGAGLAFALLDLAASRGFRIRMRGDPSETVALGALFAPVAIAASVGLALLVAHFVTGWAVWFLGAFAPTLSYLLLDAVEMALADRVGEQRKQREGGTDDEEDEDEGD